MSVIKKQELKKKKQRQKNQDIPSDQDLRLKVRKPQHKERKYKNNKQFWLEEEE